jgi:hypothetical protein
MKIKDVLFAIAILVLTIFVSYYGINMFYPSPNYDNYCGKYSAPAQKIIETQTECENLSGNWIPQHIECIKAPCPQGYCDFYSQCSKDFDSAQKERSRNVFFIALPLGILIVVLGAWFFGLEAVGSGLMGGGIGTLIYGSGAYWPYTENWVRFLLSLVGLIALIWFAYFLSRRKGKRS